MNIRTKPEWLRKNLDFSSINGLTPMLRALNLNTVCESAKCPNRGECFKKSTATFMILGNVCSRNCRFCAVTEGCPVPVDENEPEKVAEASEKLNLKHVVVTSVTRDDLPDGGAEHFAKTVKAIRNKLPGSTVEVLIPDFKGDFDALMTVINSRPDIINHNMETVPRLYPEVRPMAKYQTSLTLLHRLKEYGKGIFSKTGIMVGLGETDDEVLKVMDDLIAVSCDVLTIGQYLPPSKRHAALKEYVSPEKFDYYREMGLEKGFRFVASAPLVRSSYNAADAMNALDNQ